MNKKLLRITYLTPDTRSVTFPSGEQVIAKHVFELKDFVVLGDDKILYVFKKDRFFVLMSIKLNNKYFDESYDKKQNTLEINYHGQCYAELNLDEMEPQIKQKGNAERRIVFTKNTDEAFFCALEKVSEKSFYLQFGTAGNSYSFFLQVRSYVLFGDGNTFTVRDLEKKEKFSLLAEENASIIQVKAGQKDTGCVVFVKKNGEESVFDLISKKVVSGEVIVKTL